MWPIQHVFLLANLGLAVANPAVDYSLQHTVASEYGSTHAIVRDSLLAAKIIPQVLDDFEPKYYLDVVYSDHEEKVVLGNNIPVKRLKHRPRYGIHWLHIPGPPPEVPLEHGDLNFTLALTDPDALSYRHPVKSEMLHWLVTNLTVPKTALGDSTHESWADIQKKLSHEIKSYLPPSPPKKTGPHRYVFVLLEGNTTNLVPPRKRPHWGYGKNRHGVRDWAEENNLAVVGANFFFAHHKKQ